MAAGKLGKCAFVLYYSLLDLKTHFAVFLEI